MATIGSQWFPSPCNDPNCHKSHRTTEDGNTFHPGVYIKIKGYSSYEICLTKFIGRLTDKDQVIPLPHGKVYLSPGSLDIRTLVIQKTLVPRIFDFVTIRFPQVVETMQNAHQEQTEKTLQAACPEIWEDAVQLEESSHGI